jgi:hypothetical protein
VKKIISTLIALLAAAALLLQVSGCGYKMVYLLDQPVSDPIMYADDSQDSDLCKVEDGGSSGSSGECPT